MKLFFYVHGANCYRLHKTGDAAGHKIGTWKRYV